jgi:peptide/nickel transport system substrate-binding protein
MTQVEPTVMNTHNAFRGSASEPGHLTRLFNAAIALGGEVEEGGPAFPYLVERLPEVGSDTWRVFPDGRMETTYLLRPGLTWHDGAPLTAGDFLFSWGIMKAPEYGVETQVPTSLIEDVVAPDPRTIVVRWSSPYTLAHTLRGARWSTPLPRHLLEAAFAQQRPDQFASQPFWTRDYVGAGPYRLERWESGAFIEASAFEGHALGRPHIDRVKAVFVGNPNTALANLLAGEVHMAIDFALGFEQSTILRREWALTNSGTLVQRPDKLRYVQIQFKTEYVNPREIMDVRIRRGLWAAMDQQAFVEGLLDGQGTVAQTMVPPTVEYYGAVERAITKHPYDPNQAHQLFTAAGLTRSANGIYLNPEGSQFSPELRAVSAGQTAREGAILADLWRRIGVDIRERYMSEAEDSDPEVRSTFPSFSTANSGIDEGTLVNKIWGPNISLAANRWRGTNRGGYVNPEMDRAYDLITGSLRQEERDEASVNAMRIVNNEIPIFPLYFNDRYGAYANTLLPPPNSQPSQQVGTDKIHEWRWRT